MGFYGYSTAVKKLAFPKANLHPLKWLMMCKECLCIECNAKNKIMILFSIYIKAQESPKHLNH